MDGREERWLELLLADADTDTFSRHRDELLTDADDAAHRSAIDRRATAAMRLRARLTERSERAGELAALNSIANRLPTLHEHTALLSEIVDQAKVLLRTDLAYLGLITSENTFVIEVTSGAMTPDLVGLTLPTTSGLVGMVITRGAPVWTERYDLESRFPHIAMVDDATRAEGIHGLLGVPLRTRDDVIGALLVGNRRDRVFSEADVALLSSLAAHAAVAIDNTRALTRTRSALDELNKAHTQLSNRTRQLERTLEWDRRLTQVVLDGGSVDQLVRQIGLISGYPTFFLADPSAPPPSLHRYTEDVEALLTPADTGPSTLERPIDDGARVLIGRPVAAAGANLGVLLSAAPASAADDQRLVIERAAPAVALALTASHAATLASSRARDAFVIDLLSRPGPSAAERHDQFRRAGLNPDAFYCVLVAEPDTDLAAVHGHLRDRLSTTDPVLAEHGRRLVGLIPTTDAGRVLERTAVPPTAGTIGISGPHRGGAALARGYQEATQTVQVLHALGRTGETASADSLGIYRILLTHIGHQHIRQMIADQLGPLIAEERGRGVPLIDSLATYFECGRRLAPAATALGIHVNTLYQRFDAVDRVIGRDWRDPKRSLELQVLLELRRTLGLLTDPDPPRF